MTPTDAGADAGAEAAGVGADVEVPDEGAGVCGARLTGAELAPGVGGAAVGLADEQAAATRATVATRTASRDIRINTGLLYAGR